MPNSKEPNGRQVNMAGKELLGVGRDDYEVLKAVRETESAVKRLLRGFDDLSKAAGSYGKEAEKSFRKLTFSDSQKVMSGLMKEIDQKFQTQKKELEAIYNQDKYFKELLEKARTSQAKANAEEQKRIAKRIKELEELQGSYEEIITKDRSGKKRRTGQFFAKGNKLEEELLGKKLGVNQFMSKADTEFIGNAISGELSSLQEKSLQLQESFGEQNVSITTTAMDAMKKAVIQVASAIKQEFEKGISDFNNYYESNFTKLAGVTGTGGNRTETRQLISDVMKASSEYGYALNINDEVLPQFQKLAEAGISGQELSARAITSAVDNKILPWLDETTSTWIDISNSMDSQTQAQYKNMQLSLQSSESGRRLLQSGVIEKLNADIYPVLQNIDFNTIDKNTIPQEMLALMQTYKEQGFSDQEAYQSAKNAYDIQSNLYGALTSGDVSKIVQAQNIMKYGLGKGTMETQNWMMGMAARSGSDIAASAIGTIYNAQSMFKGGRMTVDTGKDSMLNPSVYEKKYKELQKSSQVTELYDKSIENLNQYNTATDNFNTAVQNFGSWVGKLESKFTGGSTLGSLGRGVLGGVGLYAGKKALSGGLKGLLKNIPFASSGAGAIGEGAATTSAVGGTTATTTSLLSASTLVGGGLIAGGVAMGINDAIKARKKADEWGTGKGHTTAAGLIFGSEESPSLKNTGKQMGKYALVGAGIGTMVGGPVGTLVGGAIGAGVGAVSSIVSGKDFAEWLDKRKTKKEEELQYERELKLAKASNKGNKGVVSDILKSVQNIESAIVPKTTKSFISSSKNNDWASLISDDTNKVIQIQRKTSGNANENEKLDKQDSLSYGETQIVETIKEIGKSIVSAIDSMNPSKNDIDYRSSLYKAINKGYVENSVTKLQPDSVTENSIA